VLFIREVYDSNLQTGEKQAKLYNPADDTSNAQNLVLNSGMIEVLDSSEQPKELSTQENQVHLVRDTSAPPSDQETFRNSFESLMTFNFDIPAGEGFWNLESLAHDIDFGVKIVQPEPLKRLLELARRGRDPESRKYAIRVIGSSLWNNPKAMEAVKGTNLVTDLIDILKEQGNDGVRASVIFSLSAAASGEQGVREFINAKGSDIFQEIFVKDDLEVQGKCATFVEDNLLSNRAVESVDEQLLRWCRLFQEHLLQKPTDTTSEKVFSSLMFVSVCIKLIVERSNDRLVVYVRQNLDLSNGLRKM